LHLCAQSCREFLAVSTRPASANGLGMTSTQACENLEQMRRRISTLAEEKPLLPGLLRLITTYQLTGRSIHDAGIIAAALAHQIGTLVTNDVQIFALRHRGLGFDGFRGSSSPGLSQSSSANAPSSSIMPARAHGRAPVAP